MRNRDTGSDLVVVALPGVQRFIAEARSTADVSAASEIYAGLARSIVAVLASEPDGELVLPGDPAAGKGMPNRVVALFPTGAGAAAAQRAATAAREQWREWVQRTFAGIRPPGSWASPGSAGHPGLAESGEAAPEPPGFPLIHWVCVPAAEGGYRAQWEHARKLLEARRRIRDFEAVEWECHVLCSQTPCWPAEPAAPPRVPKHEQNAKLSAVGWVKREWRYLNQQDGFPSAPSIASAPYRREVLRQMHRDEVRSAVRKLERAVRGLGIASRETPVAGLRDSGSGPGNWLVTGGGPWVYPERWQVHSLSREVRREIDVDGAEAGRNASRHLQKLIGVPLARYLAVVVQDLDGMGQFLSVNAGSPEQHRAISRELHGTAQGQRDLLETSDLLGVPVYAVGDGLLVFVPAATALEAAEKCHGAIPGSLPAASTTVLFFHCHASIQQAMRDARTLLDDARKQFAPGKHALAVGYLRRSGVREVSIQPWDAWDGQSGAGLFGVFARGGRLSPRLVADLERDKDELGSLRRESDRLYQAELVRLIRRHVEGKPNREAVAEIAAALGWLGRRDGLDKAGRVGVFLRQETSLQPEVPIRVEAR